MVKETDVTFCLPGKKDQQTAKLSWGSPTNHYGVILGHGASGGIDSGHLPVIAGAFAADGIWCLRYGSKSNLNGRIACCEALLEEVLKLQRQGKISVTKWAMAGHSMGGRVASAVAHAHPEHTLACVFFSYPLHPPGKTDQLRDVPLTSLQAPLLFVRGTKDAFSEGRQFEAVLKRLTSPKVQVHPLEGGDHSLKVKGGKDAVAAAVKAACDAAIAFVHEVTQLDVGAGATQEPPAAAEGAGGAAGGKQAGGKAERAPPKQKGKRKEPASGEKKGVQKKKQAK